MATDNTPPRPVSRWSRPSTPARSSPFGPYRFIIRLAGIPIIAIAAVLLYRGMSDRLELPPCDSAAAKRTLSEVLKQLKLEPVQYAPIKTVSTSKTEVVCNAVMPLPDGASVVADYTFYWQSSKPNMKYSIHRQAPQS
jgi:hypothetical protein